MDRPSPTDTDRHGSLSLRRGGDAVKTSPLAWTNFQNTWGWQMGALCPCGKASTLSGQIGFMHRPERDTATRTGPALKLSMCPTAPQIARTSVILYSIFLMYESTRWAASGTNWLCTLLQLFKKLATLMDISNKYRFKQQKTMRLSLRQCMSWMNWFTAAFEHIMIRIV